MAKKIRGDQHRRDMVMEAATGFEAEAASLAARTCKSKAGYDRSALHKRVCPNL